MSAPNPLPGLLGITAVTSGLALALAWTAGWIAPDRLTSQRFLDTLEGPAGPAFPGHRRAHAKGFCVLGEFQSNGAGAALSRAEVLAAGTTPFLGRMSIGGGSPGASDASARVRSLSLQLVGRGGEEWRMAMNSFPFFAVATPEAFLAQVLANRPDPATGRPDPDAQAAFLNAHPEAQRFAQWAASAPWPTSFANTDYHGVNTFRFTNAQGQSRNVRWSLVPEAEVVAMEPGQRAQAGEDFLLPELRRRLAEGPQAWDFQLVLAEPDDPVHDPSRPWPDGRQRVSLGRIVVTAAGPEAGEGCRHLNFDPLILPPGIANAGDPVLAARSAVYSVSFNRRTREHGASEAGTGQ